MSNECLYGTKFIKCDSSYLNNKVSNHLYLINMDIVFSIKNKNFASNDM